jgi:hypothetical protein
MRCAFRYRGPPNGRLERLRVSGVRVPISLLTLSAGPSGLWYSEAGGAAAALNSGGAIRPARLLRPVSDRAARLAPAAAGLRPCRPTQHLLTRCGRSPTAPPIVPLRPVSDRAAQRNICLPAAAGLRPRRPLYPLRPVSDRAARRNICCGRSPTAPLDATSAAASLRPRRPTQHLLRPVSDRAAR